MRKLMMFAAVMAAMAVHAALTPATLFSDHCVLQRGRNVPVWGKADPGATVTVEFAGQKKKAKADGNGRWRVDLDPLEVSCEPREMRIAADGAAHEEIVLKDVLVGVVWLCGGQSNMTFQMWPAPRVGQQAGREMNGYYDVMLTEAPLVRGVNMPQCWSAEEKAQVVRVHSGERQGRHGLLRCGLALRSPSQSGAEDSRGRDRVRMGRQLHRDVDPA